MARRSRPAPRRRCYGRSERSFTTCRSGSGSSDASIRAARSRSRGRSPALIGPEPRVIADDIWAKLMWAGLNLTQRGSARARQQGGHRRAVVSARARPSDRAALAVLRSAVDEILRLRVGAIRWQAPDGPDAGEDGRVCLLDVPVSKTTHARSPSPSTPSSAMRSTRWQAARPAQPRFPDRKTGELVDMLLAYRGAPVGQQVHQPCPRPLVVPQGRRPPRGRAWRDHEPSGPGTIATQLYNAKDPMSLFELQAWLGHSSPQLHPALRPDHTDHADEGLHRRWLLRPQRPHDRGAARPRRRPDRRRRQWKPV